MSKKFTLLFSSLLLLVTTVFAQSSNSSSEAQVFYVQCPGLNYNSYTALHNAVKLDGRFTIATACIPAHVLTIQVVEPNLQSVSVSENFVKFNLLATDSQLSNVSLLTNYTKLLFEQQCQAARTGN
jgi:hypothetical protein